MELTESHSAPESKYDNSAYFAFSDNAHITNVNFMEISSVLTNVGGTATACKALIIGAFSIFIFKEWELSIIKDCLDDDEFKIFD